MCCCAVMLAMVASTINVVGAPQNNGRNLLLVHFLLLASKVYELEIILHCVEYLLLSGFHGTVFNLSTTYALYCIISPPLPMPVTSEENRVCLAKDSY